MLDAVRQAGVANRFEGVPAYVECAVRADGEHEYVFLLNHDAERGATVPVDGTDLLTGAAVGGEVELAPLGAAVVRRPLAG